MIKNISKKLAFLLLLAVACSSSTEKKSEGMVVGRSQALNLSTIGAVSRINGTYTNCSSHQDGDSWSLYVGNQNQSTLQVELNDADCQLTITDVAIDSIPYYPYGAVIWPHGPLGDQYLDSRTYGTLLDASLPDRPDEPSFYANAKISPADFSNPNGFTLTFMYSSNASELDYHVARAASFVGGVAFVRDVYPTNYTVVSDTVKIYSDAATPNVVSSVEGALGFQEAPSSGNASYRVFNGEVVGTWGDLDSAYLNSASPPGSDPISGAVSVPASVLLQPGDTLPTVRTVIFRRTDEQSGVPSYQFFNITFD